MIPMQGEKLTLNCSLDDLGRPLTTKVRWYRGGRLVSDVTDLQWVINPVSLETESNFTCLPYNSVGEGSSADVDIDVMGE